MDVSTLDFLPKLRADLDYNKMSYSGVHVRMIRCTCTNDKFLVPGDVHQSLDS